MAFSSLKMRQAQGMFEHLYFTKKWTKFVDSPQNSLLMTPY